MKTHNDDEDDDYNKKEEHWKYIERMLQDGNVVIYPEKDELFIDIDTRLQYHDFLHLFGMMENNFAGGGDYKKEVWESRSGPPRKHVVVTLPFDVNEVMRIALQASLGSDPQREILSLARMSVGITRPTIFVESPGFKWKKKKPDKLEYSRPVFKGSLIDEDDVPF